MLPKNPKLCPHIVEERAILACNFSHFCQDTPVKTQFGIPALDYDIRYMLKRHGNTYRATYKPRIYIELSHGEAI